MKWTTKTTLLGLLAPLLVAGAPLAQKDTAKDAPVVQPVEPATGYIVTLKPGIAANLAWAGDLQRRGLVKRQEEGQDLKTFDLFDYHGYAGVFDEETIAEIEASEEVRHSILRRNPLTIYRSPWLRKTSLAT
jgi:oryzin